MFPFIRMSACVIFLLNASSRVISSSTPSTAIKRHHGTIRAAFHIGTNSRRIGMTKMIASSPSSEPSSPKKRRRVAIIGGGLAGLSTAWHLCTHPNTALESLTIFDPRPPGSAEASSVAGGLLHPLTPKNRLIWAGLEGYKATVELLEVSKAALHRTGDEAAVARLHSAPAAILRPALTSQHKIDYQNACDRLPEWIQWLEGEAWETKAGGSERGKEGLLLRNSIIISMPDYLRGLWLAIQQQRQQNIDIQWENRQISSLKEEEGGLEAHDTVLIASGAGIRMFPELKNLPVELVKGRTLLIEDQEEAPLASALLCGEYVVPGVDVIHLSPHNDQKRILRCGATREYIKSPWTEAREGEEEKGEEGREELETLRAKSQALYPALKKLGPPYAITTGTRVATKRSNLGKLPVIGRLPLVQKEEQEQQTSKAVWLYTGLGGRGMIHHAYLGRLLADAIFQDDEDLLPPQVRAPVEKLSLD